jgi:hypothetical protein
MSLYATYPGIPRTYDRDGDGRLLYPDEDAYLAAVKEYCEQNGMADTYTSIVDAYTDHKRKLPILGS